MASLVLGAVGGVIGGYLSGGNPAAIQAGFAIGAMIGGSSLFQPRTQLPEIQGPRLNDKAVQSSAYGQSIPVEYGNTRLAGNVIWATDIIETSSQSTQSSGKGGGGASQTTTTYSYSVSLATGLCEGPVAGILRIWADSKLIYDPSGVPQVGPITTIPEVGELRVHIGDETQTADSLIAAAEGANTPAFRGLAYVVFDNMQLANFANHIPNIQIEVAQKLTPGDSFTAIYRTAAWIDLDDIVYNATANELWFVVDASYPMPGDIVRINPADGSVIGYISLPGSPNSPWLAMAYDAVNAVVWAYTRGTGNTILYKYNAATAALTASWTISDIQSPHPSPFDGTLWYVASTNIKQVNISTGAILATYAAGATPYALAFDAADNIWFTTGSTKVLRKMAKSGGAVTSYDLTGIALYNLDFLAYDSTRNSLFIETGASTGETIEFSLTSLTVVQHIATHSDGGATYARMVYDAARGVTWFTSYANGDLYGIEDATGATYKSEAVTQPAGPTLDTSTDDVYVVALDSSPGHFDAVIYKAHFGTAAAADVLLSDVVSDLCVRAGLSASDIDVTLLAATYVHGYLVPRQMSARDALVNLQAAYFFDGVESDAKIKFVPRGQASVLTITDDDVAAVDYAQAGTLPDLITPTRKQELEMPKQVTVGFYNRYADYQPGSQYDARLITSASNQLSQDLAVVLSDAEAAAIASILLYNDWQQREQFALSLSRQYAFLDPCDVVTYVSAVLGMTFVLRITDEQYGMTGILALGGCPEDAGVYTSPNAGANANPVAQSVIAVGITTLALMDLPCALPGDDSSGFYIAGCGSGDGWSSALVNKSTDGGSTWTPLGYISGGVLGATTASPAVGDLSNTIDTSTVINVRMDEPGFTLASVSDLELYNGANACALGDNAGGWELIQFGVASLQMDGSYNLSRLLRCRKGSDATRPATFLAGSTLVYLSSGGEQRFAIAIGEVSIPRNYEAISSYDVHGAPTNYSFTFKANSLRPYAPCNFGAARDGSGNMTINWTRRDRLDNDWRDGVDVPMSEATEAYEVDILTSLGVWKRTIGGLASPTCSYTAAQQTTDFGSPQAAVNINVFQISAAVGRGLGGVATV